MGKMTPERIAEFRMRIDAARASQGIDKYTYNFPHENMADALTALEEARRERDDAHAMLRQIKYPSESCKEERAEGNGGCGVCSICCTESRQRAEAAEQKLALCSSASFGYCLDITPDDPRSCKALEDIKNIYGRWQGTHDEKVAAEQRVKELEQHLGIKEDCSTHNFESFVELCGQVAVLQQRIEKAVEGMKWGVERGLTFTEVRLAIARLKGESDE